jgi:hypothetical protein
MPNGWHKITLLEPVCLLSGVSFFAVFKIVLAIAN